MKLILFIDSLVNGGSQRQLVNLAIGLRERNHDVTVITYWPLNYHLARLQSAGVAFECLYKKGRFDLRPIWSLYHAIQRLNADVVLAFLHTPSFYAEVAGILSPRTGVVVSERAGITHTRLGVAQFFMGVSHIMADQVTGNSHHYLDELCEKLPWLKRKSTVIYNGIDSQFFANGRQRSACKLMRTSDPSVNTNPEPIRICIVAARVSEEKGLLPLVQATSLLVKRAVTNFSIHWIGQVDTSNPIAGEALTQIDQQDLNDRWYWEGQLEEIAIAYLRYDALVLPSLHEGVANSLCEAMASGLPVVATNIADNSRIVKQGYNGFLCHPDDPMSLANALQLLIEAPAQERRQMGKNSYETAKSLFSQIPSLACWEQVLRKACQ